jgi:hypothetical protein
MAHGLTQILVLFMLLTFLRLNRNQSLYHRLIYQNRSQNRSLSQSQNLNPNQNPVQSFHQMMMGQ